jgi:predicted DNA binding CopG/RHH family protein
MRRYKLDTEERELLASFKRGEWKKVSNFEKEKVKLKSAAKNYLEEKSRENV